VGRGGADAGEAEMVVPGALLAVRQARVGLRRLLEALLRLLVSGIAIGMVPHRQLAIRLLDRGLVRVPRDAENLVVVAFFHWWPPAPARFRPPVRGHASGGLAQELTTAAPDPLVSPPPPPGEPPGAPLLGWYRMTSGRVWDAPASFSSDAVHSLMLAEARALRAPSMILLTALRFSSSSRFPNSANDRMFESSRPSSRAWMRNSSARFLSSSACCSASSMISVISRSVKPPDGLTTIFCSFLVAMSRAETLTMPLLSMSKVTSTWGTPFGAGAMPTSSNR